MTHSITEGIAIGTVPLSISDVVQYLPEYFDDLAMLLTCVDSSQRVSSLLGTDDIFAEARRYEDAVLLPKEAARKIIEQGWPFDGFEEIYLLKLGDSASSPRALQTGRTFTTDSHDFASYVPPEFIQCFQSIKAARFLADGCGLNFACEPHFAKKLEELDATLAPGDPAGASDDSEGRRRRIYFPPLTGPANSTISWVRVRRPGGKEPE